MMLTQEGPCTEWSAGLAVQSFGGAAGAQPRPRTGLVCHRGGMCIIDSHLASSGHSVPQKEMPPGPLTRCSHGYFGPHFQTWALPAGHLDFP